MRELCQLVNLYQLEITQNINISLNSIPQK